MKYGENKEVPFSSKLDIINLTVEGDNIELRFSDIIFDETGVPLFKYDSTISLKIILALSPTSLFFSKSLFILHFLI